MNKSIILGIDFSTDYTQLSILGDGSEIEALIMSGIGVGNLIPSVMFYNTQLKEWAIGTEAVNRSIAEEGVFVDILPDKMAQSKGVVIEDEEIEWSEIAAIYFKAIIDMTLKNVDGVEIRNIIFSVDDPDERIMQAIYGGMNILQYDNSCIRVINHAESFAYYVLNQNRDIWINMVLMVDFGEHHAYIRKLFVTKGREPYTVDVKKIDISDRINFSMLKTEDGCHMADAVLSELLQREIDRNVISGVFLNGQGFMKEGWYNRTIQTICNGRRIFAGNNLIIKGAIYAAKEIFLSKLHSDYVISCKGRTEVNVSMNVIHRGAESKVILSKAGVHWYEAGAKTQCIIDNVNEAQFQIVWPATKKKEEFKVMLDGFPERGNKTVRVEISLAYTDEHTFIIEIKDIGFGDFFMSSGAIVRHEVKM